MSGGDNTDCHFTYPKKINIREFSLSRLPSVVPVLDKIISSKRYFIRSQINVYLDPGRFAPDQHPTHHGTNPRNCNFVKYFMSVNFKPCKTQKKDIE